MREKRVESKLILEACLLCLDIANGEERADHQHDADGEADDPVLDKAREHKAHKAQARDRDGIGQLRGDVVDMLHLRTGGGHVMVVSEMGEQWSPHTAPAQQAEIPM